MTYSGGNWWSSTYGLAHVYTIYWAHLIIVMVSNGTNMVHIYVGIIHKDASLYLEYQLNCSSISTKTPMWSALFLFNLNSRIFLTFPVHILFCIQWNLSWYHGIVKGAAIFLVHWCTNFYSLVMLIPWISLTKWKLYIQHQYVEWIKQK